MWVVTNAVLREHDIQAIVNCSNEGDSIDLQTSRRIQPSSRIVIPWQLTIERTDTENEAATLTCPPNNGLFLIQ